MKRIALSLVGLFFICLAAVQAGEEKAVVFRIDTPNPGWKVEITGLYEKDGTLLVIAKASHDGNPTIDVISKAESTALTDAAHAKLPKKFHLLGRKWNWGDGYTPITEKERDALIEGTKTVKFTLKEEKPEAADFIGMELKDAEKLADKHSIPHRVVKIDGKSLPATADFVTERLNFSVVDGKITKVNKG